MSKTLPPDSIIIGGEMVTLAMVRRCKRIYERAAREKHKLLIDYDRLWDEASGLREALRCIAEDDYPEEFVARATEPESARMFARAALTGTGKKR